MSDIRKNHPGYYGVCMAIGLIWYTGTGIGLLIDQSAYKSFFDYRFVDKHISLTYWALLYLTLGLGLVLSASIPKIPHVWVRGFTTAGMALTVFWLAGFIISLIMGHRMAYVLIPPFAAIALTEYRAIVENDTNPAMQNKEKASD